MATASFGELSAPAGRPDVGASDGQVAAEAPSQIELPEALRSSMLFTENRGQVDTPEGLEVHYYARLGGATYYFTDDGVTQDLPADAASGQGSGGPRGVVLRTRFDSPRPGAVPPEGKDRSGATSNFFLGNDPSGWQTDVPNFQTVTYADVWPGIGVEYEATGAGLKYNVLVAPRSDPSRAGFVYDGAQGLTIGPNGDLVIRTAAGDVVERAPFAFQEVGGTRAPVAARFELRGPVAFGFALGDYDPDMPLVIDPQVQIEWATYLGGDGDDVGWKIDQDYYGNLIVAGDTTSSDFPINAGAYGVYDDGPRQVGDRNGFVAKLSANGSVLKWATYLGGSLNPDLPDICWQQESTDPVKKALNIKDTVCKDPHEGTFAEDGIRGLDVDYAGDIVVSGHTHALDFPTTEGVYQPAHGGGNGMGAGTGFGFANPPQSTGHDYFDAFVAKIGKYGNVLKFSTYLGGPTDDAAWCVYAAADGSVYVGGTTGNTAGFPVTEGAFQPTYGGGDLDAFITKLGPNATRLERSTYLGGPGREGDYMFAMDTDSQGNLYVVGSAYLLSSNGWFDYTVDARVDPRDLDGRDLYVAKFTPSGSRVFASRLPGMWGMDIKVDDEGSIYVVGIAKDLYEMRLNLVPSDIYFMDRSVVRFSGAAAAYKLSPDGSTLVYSTFFGGDAAYVLAFGLDVDADHNAYITGYNNGPIFPFTSGAIKGTPDGTRDTYLIKLDPEGGLVYGTHLGGRGADGDASYDIYVDDQGGVFLTGYTDAGSPNFPVTSGAFQTMHRSAVGGYNFNGWDAFLAKLSNLAVESAPPPAPPVQPGVPPESVVSIKGPLAAKSYGSNSGFGSPLQYHLWWDDDRYLTAEPKPTCQKAGGVGTAICTYAGPEWEATLPLGAAPDTVASLQLVMSASYEAWETTSTSAEQSILAWNVATSTWDEIDHRFFPDVKTNDDQRISDEQTFAVTIPNPADYVAENGDLKLTVKAISALTTQGAGRGTWDLLRVVPS